MNIIFRVMRTDRIDYDEYEGFVVVAKDVEHSLDLIKNYQNVNDYTWRIQHNKENLVIEQYGLTERQPEVVLASFNNG